jgi:hypothetical protein
LEKSNSIMVLLLLSPRALRSLQLFLVSHLAPLFATPFLAPPLSTALAASTTTSTSFMSLSSDSSPLPFNVECVVADFRKDLELECCVPTQIPKTVRRKVVRVAVVDG